MVLKKCINFIFKLYNHRLNRLSFNILQIMKSSARTNIQLLISSACSLHTTKAT